MATRFSTASAARARAIVTFSRATTGRSRPRARQRCATAAFSAATVALSAEAFGRARAAAAFSSATIAFPSATTALPGETTSFPGVISHRPSDRQSTGNAAPVSRSPPRCAIESAAISPRSDALARIASTFPLLFLSFASRLPVRRIRLARLHRMSSHAATKRSPKWFGGRGARAARIAPTGRAARGREKGFVYCHE